MKLQIMITQMTLMMSLIHARPFEDKDITKRLLGGVQQSTYRGGGTYFYPKTQGGPIGACGPYEDNNSQIVALNADQYGPLDQRSDWCGKKVKICHRKICTVATITDACPRCEYGGLDLTPAVWDQLYGDRSRGVLDIVWSLFDEAEQNSILQSVEKKVLEKISPMKPVQQKSVKEKPTHPKSVKQSHAHKKSSQHKSAKKNSVKQKFVRQKLVQKKVIQQKPTPTKSIENKPTPTKSVEKTSTQQPNAIQQPKATQQPNAIQQPKATQQPKPAKEEESKEEQAKKEEEEEKQEDDEDTDDDEDEDEEDENE